jgi:hypothetical protein
MARRLHSFRAAAVVVLFAVAAGCGQTGDELIPVASGITTGALTKEDFVQRADAICARMVEAGEAEAATPKARADVALERLIELQGRMIDDLRALKPPAGDEVEVREVLLHLGRLQGAMRALETTEGEEVLAVVAAIGVETDAVARAANRYGLFRRCDAYKENAAIQRITSEPEELPEPMLGSDLELRKPVTAPPPSVLEIRRLAVALVPSGREVLRRQDCAGGDPASPSCVTIELALTDSPTGARRAEIARLAARDGWTQPSPTRGAWPVSLLALHRRDYDATVWLAARNCTPHLQVGDGPNAKARMSRCVDTIMVTGFR